MTSCVRATTLATSVAGASSAETCVSRRALGRLIIQRVFDRGLDLGRAHLAQTKRLHDPAAVDEDVDRHRDRAVLLADRTVFVDRDEAVRVRVLLLERFAWPDRRARRSRAPASRAWRTARAVCRSPALRRCTARTTTRRSSRRAACRAACRARRACRRATAARTAAAPCRPAAPRGRRRGRARAPRRRRRGADTHARCNARRTLAMRGRKQATVYGSRTISATKVSGISGNRRPLSVTSQLCVRCFVSLPLPHWCCPRSARQRRARRPSAGPLPTSSRRSQATGAAPRRTARSRTARTSSPTAVAAGGSRDPRRLAPRAACDPASTPPAAPVPPRTVGVAAHRLRTPRRCRPGPVLRAHHRAHRQDALRAKRPKARRPRR